MPKNNYNKRPDIRYKDRKINYTRGRFGNRSITKNPYNTFEKFIVKIHIIPDRWLAKLYGSSTNGIQALRWRIKYNYRGLYK